MAKQSGKKKKKKSGGWKFVRVCGVILQLKEILLGPLTDKVCCLAKFLALYLD